MIRDPACDRCPLSSQCYPDEICIVPESDHERLMIVTRSPATKRSSRTLSALLKDAGIDESYVNTSAIKCRTESTPTRGELKSCRHFLTQELETTDPEWVLIMGNEALYSVTGKSGVMKFRGKTLELEGGRKAFVTLSPTIINRYPGMKDGLVADLKYFGALLRGEDNREPVPDVTHVMNLDQFRDVRQALTKATVVSFDIESTGFNEFEDDAQLISLGLTLMDDQDNISVWAIPLYHPESPFRGVWQKLLKKLSPALEMGPKGIAHNGKFDIRWLKQFGCNRALTFDTMLASFLLDENGVHGLKPLAQQLLGAEPWDVDAGRLLDTPLTKVLTYNGLDTYWTFRLWQLFRKELAKEKGLARIFTRILMPCSGIFADIERQGIWIDRKQLAINLEQIEGEMKALDDQLMEYVPDDPPMAVNFNPSGFLRWLLFDHLGLPVIARGKTGPSVAEQTMITLKGNGYEIADLLLQRSRLQKILSGFLRPYTEMITEDDRIHTTFKLTGTVTGRLSSGKPDQDQVVGKTKSRGVNLQQVPRDPIVRGLFGAPPGNAFLEVDFSQAELRIAAYMAQDRHMLHLYATGQDIHMATAMKITNKPKDKVLKEERKKAKAVNFGFLYGMGAEKFVNTALVNYQTVVSHDEAQAFRTAFFEQYRGLRPWHAKQRRLALKYSRVQSPIGRIRHLPNVNSPIEAVKAEALRQAINSPVQSFGSDLALIGLINIMAIFKELGLEGFPVGTVHDSCNFQIPIPELLRAIPIIKDCMENPPLDKWFGIHLNVPLVADIKVGSRWGSANEIPNDIVNNPDELEKWLNGQSLY